MRLRLFLSFLIIVLVAVVGVAVIVRTGTAREVRAFMFGSGMVGLTELQTELQAYYAANGSWDGVEGLLTSAQMHGQGQGRGQGGIGGMMNQRLRVADAGGMIVADTDGVLVGATLSASELNAAMALVVDGQTAGYLVFQGGIGYTAGDEAFLMSRLNQAAILAGAVAGGVALLLAVILATQLLRPVREMTEAAGRLAQGDLSERVPVRGNDELAKLGRTFNFMAGSLQQAEEVRRAMTADIAHELRTPLAVQRANLEALQDGIYPLTRENLVPMLEQNRLLSHLVDDLRTLALADAGQLTLERTPTNLVGLTQRVVERFQPQAAGQEVRLEMVTRMVQLPSLNLDPMRVEQILINLLSNALRFTPRDGSIRVGVTARGDAVEVSVQDSGPGIPAEALPYIFERFYRSDKARAREGGGSGLGLAIARQLARAHGGELTAENTAEGGAVFRLRLPVDGSR